MAPLSQLSPRLRQTLDLLTCGLSEKQVAYKLTCSNHTIHGYIKELHKRLGVNTRAELLVKAGLQNRLAQLRLVLSSAGGSAQEVDNTMSKSDW